jgi:predicted nucleic acid-binding protein
MILLDTNLLGRITDSNDPQGPTARHAMHALLGRGERLVIVPQNLYEFWAVATRTEAANGLGLTIEQTSQWLKFFQRRFTLIREHEGLLPRWHDLVRAHAIRSFRAHDVRLVAAMQCYGITRLLTFNGRDFAGLGVTVIDPATV